jgi:fatty-acyl-CoA synthase/long-chain acyl-CoA synthetase
MPLEASEAAPQALAANVTRLVDLIRIVTRRQPGSPAIEFEGRTISYGSLYGDAVRLTNGLRRLGFAIGDEIGILAGNSPDYIQLYLACQLAGLVAVPLNYRAVADDVAYVSVVRVFWTVDDLV